MPLVTHVEQALEVRLREKGLSFADGGDSTLCVKFEESVKVQVEFDGTKEDVQVEPSQWVCY